jgi:2'-5' RNA ligase
MNNPQSESEIVMKTRHRLFFAIRPPETAKPYILEEQSCLGPGRAVRPEHLHLTSAIIDDYPVYPLDVANRMIGVGNAISSSSFPVVLDQLVGGTDAVVMTPSEPLQSFRLFHRQLAFGMARAGLAKRRGWRFSPHVTLLYRRGRPLWHSTIPLSWTATEFVLIHSLLGETRHEELACWPLLPRRPTLH